MLSKLGCTALCLTLAEGYITRANYYYRSDTPLLISHRGDWGHYPEHALPAYVSAYYAGVDVIEFDIQVSKDGDLVIHHDAFLDITTDILDHKSKWIDRRRYGKFWCPDFTTAELKTLTLV